MTDCKMIFGLLIILSMFSVKIESTLLRRYIRVAETFCFSEDLPRHTFFRFSGKSDFPSLRIEVMHIRDLILNTTTKTEGFLEQMTTQKFGMIKFCLTNMHNEGQNVNFELVSGARANDFGTHIESGEYIKSLKNQADIAEKFARQITQQNTEGLEMLSQTIRYGGTYSIEYYFTAIFIGVIALCTYVQYKTIRNYMISRKYI